MSFALFKRYSDQGYMRFDNGAIWFGKERVVLYFTLFTAMEHALNSMLIGPGYMATKFLVSRKEGYELIKQHGASDMKDLSSLIAATIKIMEVLGMGMFKLVEADGEEGFAVLTGVSNLGLEFKNQKARATPMDFVIGGLLAGTVGYFTKGRVYSVELSCVSQEGVEECTWVVGSRESILGYIKKFAPGRMEWGKSTLNQIESAERELKEDRKLRGII